MTEPDNQTSSFTRRRLLKGFILVLLVLTSLQLVLNISLAEMGIPNLYKRMNDLLLYGRNISREVEEIFGRFNESIHSSESMPVLTTQHPLPKCPDVSPLLVGPLATYKESPSFPEMEKLFSHLLPGGRYAPTECDTKYRVAIVIPYRNREKQLKNFLYNIHPVLKRQQIDYGIYIVDQSGNNTFNRALLMNIGYAEAVKIHNYNCFVFHDVDLIPEDDRIFYGCGEQPRHLSAAINKFQYRLPYAALFGGVSQIPRAAFEKINGFSNKYFGWGGEDDDIYSRIVAEGYKVHRYSMQISRYRMISHHHEKENKANPKRFGLLRDARKRYKSDGLNTLKYKVLKTDFTKLYTMVSVQVDEHDFSKT